MTWSLGLILESWRTMSDNLKFFGDIASLPSEYYCLSFDLGRASTGVAVGDSVSQAAKAISAIKMTNFFPDCWLDIDKLIAKWQISLIIVGEPLDTPKTAKKMHGFAKKVNDLYGLPVVLLDESYTTVVAKQDLGAKAKSKAIVDSYSAVLLINHWFELYA